MNIAVRHTPGGHDHDQDNHGRGNQSGQDAGEGSRGRGRAGAASAEEAQRRAAEAASGQPKLEGLPDKPLKIGASYFVPGPSAKVKAVAEEYMKSAGLKYDPPKTFAKVDPDRAARIAAEYEKMEHAPDDPAVKASYEALAKETIAQWQTIKKSGLKVGWIKPDQDDPYSVTPRLAAQDVLDNNHLWVFPTDLGYGSGPEAGVSNSIAKVNPMLQETGEVIGGRKVVVNDVFRIVHDYFGHFKEGVGFRADGEENAWRSHSAMYSELARAAMTAETRGQNSWVNYGPYGEKNRTATGADTVYAPQKIGIMPDWTMNEGRGDTVKRAANLMKVEALLLARKHGFSAAQIRFSDKLEWVEHHGRMVLRKASIDKNSKTITIFAAAFEANYRKTEVQDRVLGTLQTCIRTLGNGQWDEEEHPRDEDGKFTFAGNSDAGDAGDGYAGGLVAPEDDKEEGEGVLDLHPDTIAVEGDEWNKQTAVRLEREYQSVKSELDGLLHKNVGEEVELGSSEEDEEDFNDNAPIVPDSWEMLSGDQQDAVKEKWKENTKSEFLDSEINNWADNGGAKDEAQSKVAHDFDNNGETEWAEDTIKEWMEARAENGNPVPYDADDILISVNVAYESNGEGTGDVIIEFDDNMLKNPHGFDPNQQLLPGIEPIEPSSYFSVEMRDELEAELKTAFDKEAEDKVSDIEPPDYLSDSVDEYQEEYWDQKDDDEKWKHAVNDTDIVNEAQQEYDQYFENNSAGGGTAEVAIPNTFDPLQETGSTSDYAKTQALARFLSIERSLKVLDQRGLLDGGTDGFKATVSQIDKNLWSDWKSSSAGTFGGQILQLATHEELGARYREMPTHRDDLIKQANEKWKNIGGFEGIKAMVRAKWETTQYLLDKAGVHSLPVYRGLRVQMPADEPIESVSSNAGRSFERFTDAHLSRNGAYSTTITPSVANNWNAGSGTKVVLRIDAPRTAVLSVPAYGINVHSEKEVVLAGTAFRNWDAWKDRAPSVDEVPIFRAKQAA